MEWIFISDIVNLNLHAYNLEILRILFAHIIRTATVKASDAGIGIALRFSRGDICLLNITKGI